MLHFYKSYLSFLNWISCTESTSGIQPSNLDLLSKCPRIPITLVRKDDEQKQPRSRSPKKNLILISLLQDYRHGIEHSNNMPVQFGFSLFRVYISPIYKPLIVGCFSPEFTQFMGAISRLKHCWGIARSLCKELWVQFSVAADVSKNDDIPFTSCTSANNGAVGLLDESYNLTKIS